MKLLGIHLIAGLMLMSVPAWAQFEEEEEETVETTETSSSSATGHEHDTNIYRPDATNKTLGIGAGLTFGSSQENPPGTAATNDILEWNTVSARFRLPSGMEIEPFVTLATGSANDKFDPDADGAEDVENTTKAANFGLGAQVRHPYRQRGNVDLFLLYGGQMLYQATESDPDGDSNSTTIKATTVSLGYGLGIDWYFWKHLGMSVDATNAAIVYTSGSIEDKVGAVISGDPAAPTPGTLETSSLTIGAIWNPTARWMFHVWY